ncbi:MAG: nucleoside deaminase, partial [Rickettsiales bacterium]|nr:nucleoside deaminase [Rickettsiales bacterium]
ADVYVTLEPCPMCAQAISFARIKRLYFGAYNPKGGGIENGAKIFQFCNHVPEVYGGVLETECSFLLKGFFEKLRT